MVGLDSDTSDSANDYFNCKAGFYFFREKVSGPSEPEEARVPLTGDARGGIRATLSGPFTFPALLIQFTVGRDSFFLSPLCELSLPH